MLSECKMVQRLIMVIAYRFPKVPRVPNSPNWLHALRVQTVRKVGTDGDQCGWVWWKPVGDSGTLGYVGGQGCILTFELRFLFPKTEHPVAILIG